MTILRAQTQTSPAQCAITLDWNNRYRPEERTGRSVERPVAPRHQRDLQQELDDITRDARQSREEVRGLRTQLANALTLAARAAPAAPQAPEDRGQKFPDSPDFSGSDRTQLRGWIAHLRMVIRHKPASFPTTVENAVCIQPPEGIGLGQILATREGRRNDRLEDLPAFIQFLEAAFGDPDRVATAERKNAGDKNKRTVSSLSITLSSSYCCIWIGILRPLRNA